MLGCTDSGFKEASAGSCCGGRRRRRRRRWRLVTDRELSSTSQPALPSSPKSLQMSPRGELKRRGAFRLLAGIITEARTASWGSIQRLSSPEKMPEKMPGCSSREARLYLSIRRPASVINASANFFIFIRVGPPFGVPSNRLKTSNIGVMCRVTRLNDHGRLQATWCLSAESRSAARRPSAPSAPLRAHGEPPWSLRRNQEKRREGKPKPQYRVM